ncbi:SusC/RagA family TonB-linked outer membrane protein [Butyricimonas sp. Marseille-P3923]|uniref:SusC/RagA family TonB-linked outer membrane protein n=1 Tax=Butyricimonas sp. Marseille-P3923 TaxID=1987504 RepID=UPI000C06FDDE|nr:SusC/RagA family TonB-linked outer membrane protein [Butyricimonas sp. Marseille-P3923]
MNKLVSLFFLVSVTLGLTSLPSTVTAQAQKITLNVRHVKLVTVLEEIQKQSGINFIYNEKIISEVNDITLDVKDAPIDTVMTRVLKGTNLQYEIHEKIIVITEKPVREKDSRKISGIVRDEKGEVLPGVTVLVKGTSVGTATDINGRFTINVPEGIKQLQFTFIGMASLDADIPTDGKEMQIALQPQADQLDEVVVTGFQTTTRRKATGSVAVVPMEVFANKAQPTVDQLLQGQVAGVSVQALSGRPGESAKIRIRGTSSLTGDAEPLWVIDGVPMQRNVPKINSGQIKSGDFNDIFVNGVGMINPNDIASITILKDASATAIYGSRAAGGVIVVTTKKGQIGKMTVNYSANVSIGLKPQRSVKLMNSAQKLAWEQELWDEFSAPGYSQPNTYYPVVGIVGMMRAGKLMEKDGQLALLETGGTALTTEQQDEYIKKLSGHTTDWFNELFRNSVSTNHHLSLSGGSATNTYYVALAYTKDNGLIKVNDYDRYNLTSNLTLTPNERVKVEFGFDLSKRHSNDYPRKLDPFTYAYYANPYETPYNEDGSYRPDFTYYSLAAANGYPDKDKLLPPDGFNIMREMNENSTKADNVSTGLRVGFDYDILKQLKFSGLASFAFTNNKTDDIYGENTMTAFNDRLDFDKSTTRTYGSITQTSSNNESYSVRGFLTYADVFNDIHRLSLLGGAELRAEKTKSIFEKRYGYDAVTGNSAMPYPDNITPQSMAAIMDDLSGQEISENRFASFFASLDYYLMERYIFSASFRTDGSNHFGSDEQFNPTWSVGASWHLGEERFMEPLKTFLDYLTLRVAMGYTGNVNPYTSPQLIMTYTGKYRTTDNNDRYRIGNVYVAPNPKLRWEKTKDMKIALEFGVLNERITGLVEGYYRLTTDAVTTSRIISSVGFTSQKYNSSKIENKGIEATLKFGILDSKDWKLTLSANFAWNQNKLKRFKDLSGKISGGYDNYEGYPMDAIFTGKPIGIDPYDGVYKFELRPDAVINKATDLNDPDNYLFYRGTSTAPYTGGFNLRCSYRGMTLNVGGSYALDAKIYNSMKSPATAESARQGTGNNSYQTYYSDLYRNHLNVEKDITNRWTEDHTTGVKYPRITDYYGAPLNLNYYNPFYTEITRGVMIENTSYLRVSNISLAYQVPQDIVRKLRLSSLNVMFTLNDFFTFTNYSGIDPETPGATYPKTRSITFGLNLGF